MKAFLAGFKAGSRLFAEKIAVLVNSLLLLPVYVLGVGTAALTARLLGKELLRKRPDAGAESYWKEAETPDKGEYYRMF